MVGYTHLHKQAHTHDYRQSMEHDAVKLQIEQVGAVEQHEEMRRLV